MGRNRVQTEKALIALYLEKQQQKFIFILSQRQVSKEIQDAFCRVEKWRRFLVSENAHHWEIDANSDSILPEEVKVERVDIVLQSQHKWGKKLMSSKINQLLTDEVKSYWRENSCVSRIYMNNHLGKSKKHSGKR